MWTIFKASVEFVTILLLFSVLVFWPRGILVPRPGIEPATPTLEGKVLTTGPPGKSLLFFIKVELIHNVVLISAVRQSDSVIHVYTFFFLHSFPLWFIIAY